LIEKKYEENNDATIHPIPKVIAADLTLYKICTTGAELALATY
jgi:hypothetical protein